MDGYYTVQRRPAVSLPLANPTVVLSSNVEAKDVSQVAVKQYSSKTMLLLIVVFVLVSVMIGTLLWILQYEISKRSSYSEINSSIIISS